MGISYRHWIDTKLSTYELHRKNIIQLKERKKANTKRLNTLREAQQVIQEVAQTIQQSAHSQITSVVTKCLETIFGVGFYEFQIKFSKKRGKTEAQCLLIREGYEIDPLEGAGLGVADVTSFALRLAKILLARPVKRRLLILDEPFRHLDRERRLKVRQLLETLSKELNFQFLIISHHQELMVGKVIDLGELND